MSAAVTGGNSLILVIDDNDAQCRLTMRVLREAGFQVVEAAGPQAGLAVAGRHPDLVVVTIPLGDIGSFAVYHQLRAQVSAHAIPVLQLSPAYSAAEGVSHDPRTDADGYLTLPIEPCVLISMVRSLLRCRRVESELRTLKGDLEHRRNQLDEILSASSDHVYMFDSEGRYTYANATALRALQRTFSDVVGRTLCDLGFSPAVVEPFEAKLRQVFASGQDIRGESAFSLRGGKQHFEYVLAPVSADGKVTSVVATVRDITDRKQAFERERAARAEAEAAQRRATDILESIADAFFTLDHEWRFTYVNREAEKLLQKQRDQLLGWVAWDLFPGADAFRRRYEQALATGAAVCFEEFYAPLGNWFAMHAYPSKEGLSVYFHLVTERKCMEEALRDSESRFHAAVDNFPGVFVIYDSDRRLRYVNSSGVQASGRSLEELLGRRDEELFSPKATAGYLGHLKLAFETRQPQTFEFVQSAVPPLTGGATALVNYVPLLNDDGSIRQVLGIVYDISEQKRAQAELAGAAEWLRLAQEASRIGSFDWDIVHDVLFWSKELQQLYGFQPDGFPSGQKWSECVLAEDLPIANSAIAQSLKTGEYAVDYRIRRHDDGEVRWMTARGKVFFDPEGRPVRMVGVNSDITDRKQTEAAMRHTEKFAATGRLAATLAHEINNPMAAVTNLIYLLAADSSLSPSAREYVSLAQKELARMGHITRQMLGFYRENQVPVSTRVPDLLGGVLDLYARRIAQARVEVITEYEYTDEISSFPGAIRQVFSNLLVNALDAMEHSGGKIRVRVKRGYDWKQGNRNGVRIVIADNGPGIRREDRRRIFEPFFTTKGERGTGLGLWVTQGVVEKIGGTICFRSSTRQGTTGTCFAIFVPAEVQTRAAAAPRARTI